MLTPGDILGEYRLVERIGRGLRGEVWRADPVARPEAVIVKVIRETSVTGPNRPRAFERLSATLDRYGRLRHPNLLPVIGSVYRASDGLFGLVHPGMPGHNLEHITTLDPRPGEKPFQNRRHLLTIASIIDQIADVTDYLHARGTMHGNIKPTNIWLEDDGVEPRVLLLDFCWTRAGLGGYSETQSQYIPPELRERRPLGARADDWSTARVLQKLLSRLAPDVSEHELLAQLPANLFSLMQAALERDPAQRVLELDAIMEALGVKDEKRLVPRPSSGRGNRPRVDTTPPEDLAFSGPTERSPVDRTSPIRAPSNPISRLKTADLEYPQAGATRRSSNRRVMDTDPSRRVAERVMDTDPPGSGGPLSIPLDSEERSRSSRADSSTQWPPPRSNAALIVIGISIATIVGAIVWLVLTFGLASDVETDPQPNLLATAEDAAVLPPPAAAAEIPDALPKRAAPSEADSGATSPPPPGATEPDAGPPEPPPAPRLDEPPEPEPPPKDVHKQALSDAVRLCERRKARSCREAADLHLSGRLGRKDTWAAAVYLERACRLQLSQCLSAGRTLQSTGHPKAARRALERACDNRNAAACAQLAGLWRSGAGGRKSVRTADAFQLRACKLGRRRSCL